MLRTILPIIFLLFPFLSCSDDKNDIIPSVAIVGTWNRTSVVFEGMDDPGFDVVKFSFDADKHFVSYMCRRKRSVCQLQPLAVDSISIPL